MHSLEGILSALDPSVHESVKIISYFDALVSERVGVDGLLRAAAVLAGCPAGATTGNPGEGRRVDVHGVAVSVRLDAYHGWPLKRASGDDVIVWIERSGPSHINDEMLLERLALAMGITSERTTRRPPRPALNVLVDAFAPREDKESMARALGMSPTTTTRVVASPAAVTPLSEEIHSAVLPTEVGLLRVFLYRGGPLVGRAGIGIPTPALELASSWKSAITALKLTTQARPVTDAADLGVLLQLGSLNLDDPDVAALVRVSEISPWAVPTLDALAEGGSVRAAAVLLERHPSTVHTRIDSLSSALGFDVRSPLGRARAGIAVALWRMNTAAF